MIAASFAWHVILKIWAFEGSLIFVNGTPSSWLWRVLPNGLLQGEPYNTTLREIYSSFLGLVIKFNNLRKVSFKVPFQETWIFAIL